MPKLKRNQVLRNVLLLPEQVRSKEKKQQKSHILTKKETKQKNLTSTSYVAKVDEKSVQRQLTIKVVL